MEAFLAEFLPTPCGRGSAPKGDIEGWMGAWNGWLRNGRSEKLRDSKFMVVQPTPVSKFMSVSSPPFASVRLLLYLRFRFPPIKLAPERQVI